MVDSKISVYKAEPAFMCQPEVWAFVENGLKVVKSRIGTRSNWTPMHVRQSILTGNSELWMLSDVSTHLGFYILTVVNDPFIHVPTTLFVWIAYGTQKHLIEEGFPYVVQRAKELGINTIEMMSPRRGWIRRLLHLGFDVADVIYSLKLNG